MEYEFIRDQAKAHGMSQKALISWCREWDQIRRTVLDYVERTGHEIYLTATSELSGEKYGGKPEDV